MFRIRITFTLYKSSVSAKKPEHTEIMLRRQEYEMDAGILGSDMERPLYGGTSELRHGWDE